MPSRALAPAVSIAVLLSTVSCSDTIDLPSVGQAGIQFARAWDDRDVRSMYEQFAQGPRGRWSPGRLDKWLRTVLEDGDIDSFDVDIDAASAEEPEVSSSDELDDLTADVPYVITYQSGAALDPVELRGQMPLVYEGEKGWRVSWSESLMWPGIADAAGFGVELKGSERGKILDRDGEVLARGSTSKRKYPNGSVAGSTIGHIGEATKKDAGGGVVRGELFGASGLEAGLDDRLTAANAADLVVVDPRGRTIDKLGSRPAGPPEDVRVTLDIEMQRAAENAFGGRAGGAVVMDPTTGDLLAIVSSSPFDPNNYVGEPKVFPFNRALSGTYPPGSAMKVVTASAALDTGLVTPETEVTGPSNYKGVHNFDSGSFGTIPFAVATENSVNTAYAQVAEDLGRKKLMEYAERFGFNKRPKMPLAAATPSFPKPKDLADLMWSAIGQAQVIASPLEMATVAATVANDGTRMEPRILLDQPTDSVEVMTAESAATMTDLMERVVTSGTGQAANLGEPDVAGKTGTAEVTVGGGIQNHAWFICFAPSEDPQVAVAVVAEFGGVGGEVAAPLARQILQAVLPLV